ncbi:hypothetical protein RF11_11803 [Thelohanellus kitauei]|uniref:Uncharacterized protein n=1 Tax=Thelohanellus kitauei TaxID=669202 RepID=A0A0C2IHH4_THEKT|nr:hypothetical protein RF11_11803 [Thelohanellus kitauei]
MYLRVLGFFLFVTISKQSYPPEINMRKLSVNIRRTNFTVDLNIYIDIVLDSSDIKFHSFHLTKIEFDRINSELNVEFNRDESGHEKRRMDMNCKILDKPDEIEIHRCTVSPKDQVIQKEWIYSFGQKIVFKKNVKYVFEKHHNHFKICGCGRDTYLLLIINNMTIQSHCTSMVCEWKKPNNELEYSSFDSDAVIAPCESDRLAYSYLHRVCDFTSILYFVKYYLNAFIRKPICWISLIGMMILLTPLFVEYLL